MSQDRVTVTDAAVGAAAAAIQVRMDKTIGLNDLARAALEAAAPHLIAFPMGMTQDEWEAHVRSYR